MAKTKEPKKDAKVAKPKTEVRKRSAKDILSASPSDGEFKPERAKKDFCLSESDVAEFIDTMRGITVGKTKAKGIFGFFIDEEDMHYCGRGGISQEKAVEVAMSVLTMANISPAVFAAFIISTINGGLHDDSWARGAERNGHN